MANRMLQAEGAAARGTGAGAGGGRAGGALAFPWWAVPWWAYLLIGLHLVYRLIKVGRRVGGLLVLGMPTGAFASCM